MKKMKKYERVVKKWYDALEEGKFLATKCERCGSYEFPPLYCCNSCGGMEMVWEEISGNAKLLSFVLNGPMSESEKEPYCLGCVQLEEGTTFNAIVFGLNKQNAKEINSRLPVPLKIETLQREGYKTIAFRVQESAEEV